MPWSSLEGLPPNLHNSSQIFRYQYWDTSASSYMHFCSCQILLAWASLGSLANTVRSRSLQECCFNVNGVVWPLSWCTKYKYYLHASLEQVGLSVRWFCSSSKPHAQRWALGLLLMTLDFYNLAKWNTFLVSVLYLLHCSSSVSFALISSSFDWVIKTSSMFFSSFDCSMFSSVVSGFLSTNLELLFEGESDISQQLIAFRSRACFEGESDISQQLIGFRSIACFEPSWLVIFHQL